MEIFIITIASLWLCPILSKLVLYVVRHQPRSQKIIAAVFTSLGLIIILLMIIGISTVSQTVDFLLLSIIYFSISLLLFFLYSFKNKAVKVIVGLVMLCVLAIGYLSATVGILGVGLILNNYQVDREITLDDNIIYRQFSLGSAPGWYRGIKVSIQKRSKWLPGFEREIFAKQYDRDFYDKNSPPSSNKNNIPTLYSYDFGVKYLPVSKQIVLLDSIKKDTINLK